MANILLPKHFNNGIILEPVSADPSNPVAGQQQFSDGTHRTVGMWEYTGSVWQKGVIAEDAALTGTPTAPTATQGTDTTQIATTAFANAKSELDSIGVNQTWQSVIGSRSLGVTYTNTSGKPKMVSISLTLTGLASGLIRINGNNVGYLYDGTAAAVVETFSAIIPDGGTVAALVNSGSVSLLAWYELDV